MRPTQHTVLVVDDELPVLNLLRDILEVGGFRALRAQSVEEAKRWWNAECSNISLLVTDFTLIGGTSEMLVSFLRGQNPKLPVVVISGFTRDMLQGRGDFPSDVEFLEKPFEPIKFLEVVRKMVA